MASEREPEARADEKKNAEVDAARLAAHSLQSQVRKPEEAAEMKPEARADEKQNAEVDATCLAAHLMQSRVWETEEAAERKHEVMELRHCKCAETSVKRRISFWEFQVASKEKKNADVDATRLAAHSLQSQVWEIQEAAERKPEARADGKKDAEVNATRLAAHAVQSQVWKPKESASEDKQVIPPGKVAPESHEICVYRPCTELEAWEWIYSECFMRMTRDGVQAPRITQKTVDWMGDRLRGWLRMEMVEMVATAIPPANRVVAKEFTNQCGKHLRELFEDAVKDFLALHKTEFDKKRGTIRSMDLGRTATFRSLAELWKWWADENNADEKENAEVDAARLAAHSLQSQVWKSEGTAKKTPEASADEEENAEVNTSR